VLVVDAIVVELELVYVYVYGRVLRESVWGSDLFAIQSRRNVFHLARGHVSSQKAFRGSVVSWNRKVLARILSSARRGAPPCVFDDGGLRAREPESKRASRKPEGPFSSHGQRAFSFLTFITQQAMLRGRRSIQSH